MVVSRLTLTRAINDLKGWKIVDLTHSKLWVMDHWLLSFVQRSHLFPEISSQKILLRFVLSLYHFPNKAFLYWHPLIFNKTKKGIYFVLLYYWLMLILSTFIKTLEKTDLFIFIEGWNAIKNICKCWTNQTMTSEICDIDSQGPKSIFEKKLSCDMRIW